MDQPSKLELLHTESIQPTPAVNLPERLPMTIG
jgi:hypothetical protein